MYFHYDIVQWRILWLSLWAGGKGSQRVRTRGKAPVGVPRGGGGGGWTLKAFNFDKKDNHASIYALNMNK